MDRIPVLIYHGFYSRETELSAVPTPEYRYFLSVDQFRRHVELLAGRGHTISSVERASAPSDVAFTFDDGHLSNYTSIWPILTEYGFSATFFVVAAWIGRPDRIDAGQLREMSAGGMSIASHGLTHVGLSTLPEPDLDRELRESKSRIEEVVGAEVATLAAPRGLVNRRVLARAREAGYRRVCTSNAGLMGGGFAAPRLSITRYTPGETLEGYARRDRVLIGRTRAGQLVRLGLKRMIGVRNYENLCRAILGTP